MIHLATFALSLILFAALMIWTRRSRCAGPPLIRGMIALFVVFAASTAFAADMIPAHVVGNPDFVSVADILAGFGVPIAVVRYILIACVLLYVATTELLPFFPQIKANGVFHFLVLAFGAMKVDPSARTVSLDKAQLKDAMLKAFPMLAHPKPLKEALAEAAPSAAEPEPPAHEEGTAAAAQAPEKGEAPDATQEEPTPAQPSDAEIEAAKATLAAAGIQVAAPAVS